MKSKIRSILRLMFSFRKRKNWYILLLMNFLSATLFSQQDIDLDNPHWEEINMFSCNYEMVYSKINTFMKWRNNYIFFKRKKNATKT